MVFLLILLEKTLPTEIAYADDVDFVGLNFVDTEEVQNTLHKYNLLVNIDKTEFTTLSRAGTEYKNTKKVGTLIGDEEDVERRKRLSNAALTKLLNVYIGSRERNRHERERERERERKKERERKRERERERERQRDRERKRQRKGVMKTQKGTCTDAEEKTEKEEKKIEREKGNTDIIIQENRE